MPATLAALEAERANYRAVLAAINALGANQRDHVEQLRTVSDNQDALAQRQDAMTQQQSQTHIRVRFIEDNLAEVKDLLVRALDR